MALFHTTVVDNQIKALDTIGTASGAICTFDTDRAERLVKCVCEVASGASEINVSACGVNLFGGTYNTNFRTFIPKNTQFTISAEITGNTQLRFAVYDKNEQLIDYWAVLLTESGRNYRTFNLNYDIYFVKFYYAESGTNLQVAFGTDINYQAYNGNTYNIPFGETLTDTATYDALSGVLTRNDSTTKQLDSCNIVALDNETNNVYCDTGNTEVNYIMTVGQAIS